MISFRYQVGASYRDSTTVVSRLTTTGSSVGSFGLALWVRVRRWPASRIATIRLRDSGEYTVDNFASHSSASTIFDVGSGSARPTVPTSTVTVIASAANRGPHASGCLISGSYT